MQHHSAVLTFLAYRGSLQSLGMMGSEGGRLAAFLVAPSASSAGGAFSGSFAQRRISATRDCSTVATCAVSWCSKPACSCQRRRPWHLVCSVCQGRGSWSPFYWSHATELHFSRRKRSGASVLFLPAASGSLAN